MFNNTIRLAAILFSILALTLACGQEEPVQTDQTPQNQETQARAEPRASGVRGTGQAETPGITTAAEGVQAQPQQDGADLSGPTTAKTQTPTVDSARPDTAPGAQPGPVSVQGTGIASEPQAAQEAPTSEPEPSPTPAQLSPQFAEKPLLQDIYATMDLSVYGLNPNEPLQERVWWMEIELPFEEYRDHPYLHLFPNLAHHIKLISEEADRQAQDHPKTFQYEYYRYFHPSEESNNANHYGIESFLHYPSYHAWNERLLASTNSRETYPGISETITNLKTDYFGKNSTKEVLALAVTDLLTQAKHPQAQHAELEWRGRPQYTRVQQTKLDRYLRLAYAPSNQHQTPVGAYLPPRATWDFAHPELPIVRVQLDYDLELPIARPDTPLQNARFSIGFVIAFQNRWSTFEDGNRWIIKFQEALQPHENPYDARICGTSETCTFLPKDGAIDPDLEDRYPYYWHSSDYMQHSLIGPVVMTVHNSEVLIPGTYSATPDVTHWEAPGPIITTEQALVPSNLPAIERGETPRYKQRYPFTTSVNPGYPLPGHILTSSDTGPGTEIWDSYHFGPEWE